MGLDLARCRSIYTFVRAVLPAVFGLETYRGPFVLFFDNIESSRVIGGGAG